MKISLDELAEALEKITHDCGTQSISHKNSLWCSSIHANEPGDAADPFWIQLSSGTANFGYLDDEHPDKRLIEDGVAIVAPMKVTSWQARLFCTIDLGDVSDAETQAFVATLITEYFGLSRGCEMTVSPEDLG